MRTAAEGRMRTAERETDAPEPASGDRSPVRDSRHHPTAITVVAVALALGLGAAGGWAGRMLLAPPPPLPTTPAFTLVTAAEGTVHRELALDAQASWAGGREVMGGLSGTVTRVRLSAATSVNEGQALYDVDLTPVVAAQGDIPAFRDLQAGDVGPDVRQLQRLLRATGQREAEPDGRFGPTTADEVRRWQKQQGVRPTGTVARGAVLYLPQLPAIVTATPELSVGTPAPVGVAALRRLPSSPRFSIVLPANQASLTKPGMAVQLTMGEMRWMARVASVGEPRADGSALASLGPVEGRPSICGGACARVPLAGTTLEASIVVVPRTAGVTVASQSLTVGADGSTAVVDAQGHRITVMLRATAGGIAVVDGLPAGTQVRVPTGA